MKKTKKTRLTKRQVLRHHEGATASILRTAQSHGEGVKEIAGRFAHYFTTQNRQFDRERFIQAVGP